MKHKLTHFVLWSVVIGAAALPASAQNVTGYESMSNPYLLLLREPGVIDDLDLSGTQRSALQTLNDEIDGPLLGLRNRPPDEASPKMAELFETSKRRVDSVLSAQQQRRLSQLVLRVRGIKVVLVPQVAKQLRLSDEQRDKVQATLDKTAEQLSGLQKRIGEGQPCEGIERQAAALRRDEQAKILATLSTQQRQRLLDLVGPAFDTSLLGRVAFRAPEFQQAAGWINSEPLRMEDLRGRVVALHFWAFG